jgi:nitroreductase
MLKELILKNRSYRRFYGDFTIDEKTLLELIDLARLSPSAANLQPLKYYISCDAQKNEQIFSCLSWAGYLTDWPGPDKDERPSAYIIILADRIISKSVDCDHGIALQSILLGAAEKGLGGCTIASIDKEKMRDLLDISENFDILLTLALGKPKETVKIEAMENGEIKYWRDDQQIHHVPKRSLKDIIIR